MRAVLNRIEQVKSEPHHVRRRVAVGTAGFVSGTIALVWLVTSVMTGAFAIQGSSFALTTEPAQTTPSSEDSTYLAGAAGAVPDESEDVPAYIEIVDTTPRAAPPPADPTIIPF